MENSVRATHKFLSNEEILEIKKYVPEALAGISHLIIDNDENGNLIAFMGIEENKLEMLFITSEYRGKGIGKKMLSYGIESYGVLILLLMRTTRKLKNFMNIWDLKFIKEMN